MSGGGLDGSTNPRTGFLGRAFGLSENAWGERFDHTIAVIPAVLRQAQDEAEAESRDPFPGWDKRMNGSRIALRASGMTGMGVVLSWLAVLPLTLQAPA